jgi:hypothetical protein
MAHDEHGIIADVPSEHDTVGERRERNALLEVRPAR